MALKIGFVGLDFAARAERSGRTEAIVATAPA
jgi:hypothetical protein